MTVLPILMSTQIYMSITIVHKYQVLKYVLVRCVYGHIKHQCELKSLKSCPGLLNPVLINSGGKFVTLRDHCSCKGIKMTVVPTRSETSSTGDRGRTHYAKRALFPFKSTRVNIARLDDETAKCAYDFTTRTRRESYENRGAVRTRVRYWAHWE